MLINDLFSGEPTPPRESHPVIRDELSGRFATHHLVTERKRVEQHLLWLVDMHREQFTSKFVSWLPDNFHVWRAFEKEALQVARLGVRHYSARTILHFLRHHTATSEKGGDGWKLNNDVSAYLARLFNLVNPAHADLFEMRVTKAVAAEACP